MKIGDIITEKDNYAEYSVWCNENGATIKEIEKINDVRRFKIVKIEYSDDQKKDIVRSDRNEKINGLIWRIDRFETQSKIKKETTDDEKTYNDILNFLEYLRSYPESSEKWFETKALSFEEWRKNK